MPLEVKTPVVTPKTNRRHMVAVTQYILIAALYVISFIPTMLVVNGVVNDNLFLYFYYINHVGNFFIYLAVNKEFRKEAKNLVNAVMKKKRANQRQSVFAVGGIQQVYM